MTSFSTLVVLVLLGLGGGCFLVPLLMGFAGVPGAILGGQRDVAFTTRRKVGFLLCITGHVAVILIYVAIIVTLVRGQVWWLWGVGFMAAIAPMCYLAYDASRTIREHPDATATNLQFHALNVSIVLFPFAYVVLAFAPGCTDVLRRLLPPY